MKRTIAAFSERARLDAADLQAAIAAGRPDAVLVDVDSWGALGAAEAWGGPWASYCPHPLPPPSAKAPPFGPGLRPATGAAGRLRDRLGHLLLDGAFGRLVAPRLEGVRESLGLASAGSIEEMFLGAPLLLYLTAEPFEYSGGEWPENVVMVGPCSWEPPGELPAELESVREPLVLVSTSSEFQNDGRLVEESLENLAGEPFHIVATAPALGAAGLGTGANATVIDFAAHGPILERAVCAVTHGGMGVTQKALGHGVPVCAVPFGRDQAEVARRVEVAGAGCRLSAWRLTPKRLRAKLGEAIACHEGAERVARGFAAAGGPWAAAEAFERQVLGPHPGPG